MLLKVTSFGARRSGQLIIHIDSTTNFVIALVIRSISDDCMFVHVTEFQSPANPSNA
jgi:hypothetical protein